MTELGWHLMHRLADDRPFICSVTDIRRAARIVLERGRDYELLAFGLADNHLHTLVACERRRAGRFAQVVETALHKRLQLDAPFAPFFPEPVLRQAHLYNTFRYCIRQDEHHRLNRDPFREGTNLPELLGLRALDAWNVGLVRSHLPRISRVELLDLAPRLAALEAPVQEPRWSLLADAAAAAALVPDLDGRSVAHMQARRAAVHRAVQELPSTRVADLLDASRSTVKRMRRGPPEPAMLRAIELQLQVRSFVPAT